MIIKKNDEITIKKGNQSSNEEWVIFAEDGHKVLLDTIKTPMYNPSGELIGILGIAHDITERNKILSQFEATTTLLSAIIESSPNVVVFALDKNYHYLTFNKKHKEIIKMIWGKEISVGTNMMDIFGNHPDKEKAKANFDRALAGEYLSIVEEYGDEEKTRQFWQDYYSPIYSSNGEIIGVTCFVLDISELKRAEAALKESEYFFKESQHAAFIGSYKADLLRKRWESSEVLDQIFGIDKDLYQKTNDGFFDIVHPEDRGHLKIILVEDSINKRKPFNSEFRIVRKSDGVTRWVYGLGKVIANDQGNVTSLIGTIMDITELKNASEELKASEEQLRELNATKDKFFSINAHDLRNPFSVVLGISEIMADKSVLFTMDEMRQNSELLYKTASSTYALLENLLEWSSLQRGICKLKIESISLEKFIKNLNESISEIALKKSITLVNNIPQDATILADPNMLHSILRNLLTNAIKFTSSGGSVTISAKMQSDNSFLFTVKDTGIGIPDSIMKNMFRIDINISRPGTSGEPSTGLGLILCKEFVEKHGGSIWVESEEGKGSTFSFTIPAFSD